MIFSVTLVIFLIALMNKYCYPNSVLGGYTLHPDIFVNLSWMIEVGMKIHLVSDNSCNIVNL